MNNIRGRERVKGRGKGGDGERERCCGGGGRHGGSQLEECVEEVIMDNIY
jgi:hypothetical protein